MKRAEEIAKDLMTVGGSSEQATHLKLYDGDRYLGGWSLAGLTRRIQQHLAGELSGLDARGKEIKRIHSTPGMKLFLTQAVTVSKYGSDVKVACDGPEDAKLIFEFLANLSADDPTNKLT